MLPVLRSAAKGEVRISDVAEKLADEFGLSVEERSHLLPSGRQTTFSSRVHWAKSYLGKAGLVELTKRAHFRATEDGRKVLAAPPERIDIKYLNRFPSFQQFRPVAFRITSHRQHGCPSFTRWFLSYNSSDRALAEGLKASIERKDAGSRVFFDVTSLRAGGYWQPALAKGIDEADAFVLLVGEKGLGPWQTLEYYEAQDKRAKSPEFPVVLMLLDGHPAPGLPFLRQLHWIISADPRSEKDVARLIDAAAGTGARPGELWLYTSPYRGLSAMEEKDADYFFGRGRETVEVIKALAGAPDKLPVLLGNSGVGKSSVAQAGVLAALKRQAWPEGADITPEWPHAFRESRHFLTLKPGTEPLKALVEAFLDTWRIGSADFERVKQQNGWIELLRDGKVMLRDLLDASERRYKEQDLTKPPAFLLYVDQGEELYVGAEERQRRRFSEVIAQGLRDQRLRVLMSIRSDFLGALQGDEPLLAVHRKIDVPPLRKAQLHEVVSRPAALLSAHFETEALAADIARRTVEESTRDAGALPLLSYFLDDMWTEMVKRRDGMLRAPVGAIDLGRVLAERANAFLASHPESEGALRRLLTLKLATVREDGVPTRRRAPRSEFTDDDEWRLVSELADHPNRLLVTAAPEGGETYAEVAHEAIFRRWGKLHEWIAQEREFLVWKSGAEANRRASEAAPTVSKDDALLMGFALRQAQEWMEKRGNDLPETLRQFINRSGKIDSERRKAGIKTEEELACLLAEKEARVQRERADAEALARREAERSATRDRMRVQSLRAVVGVLLIGIGAWLAWSNRAALKALAVMGADKVWYKLAAEAEHALQPLQSFKECFDCPEMVVVRDGKFTMGSPDSEMGRSEDEGPQHEVTIARSFAVSRTEVTFAQWDACFAAAACTKASDSTWGRDNRPVINVSWDDAKQYVAWLSRVTGRDYRLLTEAEWEYAARAGSSARFTFGGAEEQLDQYAWYYNYKNDGKTQPVAKKKGNAFGLHDMHGNVMEWCEDAWHDNYNGAPTDGSAWLQGGHDSRRVIRGGSWSNTSQAQRSASRVGDQPGARYDVLGFRLARTLNP
jgi:formylglycine-generating enzyme required for sulfatase activity